MRWMKVPSTFDRWKTRQRSKIRRRLRILGNCRRSNAQKPLFPVEPRVLVHFCAKSSTCRAFRLKKKWPRRFEKSLYLARMSLNWQGRCSSPGQTSASLPWRQRWTQRKWWIIGKMWFFSPFFAWNFISISRILGTLKWKPKLQQAALNVLTTIYIHSLGRLGLILYNKS